MEGGVFLFQGAPFVRDFEYRVEKAQVGVSADFRFANDTVAFVEVEGRIDTSLSAAYFEPTPFSQWQIAVPDTSIDLTNVERIVVEFAGSAIARVA